MVYDLEKIESIQGGTFKDKRGTLIYFNDFNLQDTKRFYVIEHPSSEIVRAWQGHQKEQKWFYVIEGVIKLVLVRPDDWDNPSAELSYDEFTLSSIDSQILHVPGGYASGFKALSSNSKIIIFSNFSIEESAKDDYRFNQDLWYKWKSS